VERQWDAGVVTLRWCCLAKPEDVADVKWRISCSRHLAIGWNGTGYFKHDMERDIGLIEPILDLVTIRLVFDSATMCARAVGHGATEGSTSTSTSTISHFRTIHWETKRVES